jgi:DNA helicase-2/ATP-dependent DNA helicase PcrA
MCGADGTAGPAGLPTHGVNFAPTERRLSPVEHEGDFHFSQAASDPPGTALSRVTYREGGHVPGFDVVTGNLTADQLWAVSGVSGCHVISGPPGSGKTEVLVQRAIRVLEEPSRQPFGVLALTFTSTAASNFRKRVEAALGGPQWRLTAETFHNFCLGILKGDSEEQGQEPPLTVYDSDEDRLVALQRALSREGLAFSGTDDRAELKALLSEIGRLMAELVSPDEAPRSFVRESAIPVDLAYAAYERTLARLRAVDFGGMLLGAYQLVRKQPAIGKRLRALYQQILVDDGQDMSRAHYEILRELFGSGLSSVLLACDPQQSIQGFAGADPRLVDRFATEFKASTSRLNGNHRCAGRISTVASRLGRHLVDTDGVDLEPLRTHNRRHTQGSVEAWTFADPAAEAAGVAGWVEQVLAGGLDSSWLTAGERGEVAPEEIGILGRTWREVYGLFTELQNRQIPSVVRSGVGGLFASKTGRCCYFALKVRANPNDVVSALRFAAHIPGMESVSNAWLRGGSEVNFEALLAAATGVEQGFDRGVATILQEMTSSPRQLPELIGRLAITAVDPISEPLQPLWAHDQQQLARCWRVFAVAEPPHERSLPAFLRSMSRWERGPIEGPGVRISTVHSAKGLEFKVVAVIGFNDGGFPHSRALDSDAGVDAERRIAFVAVTRASRVLRLTRALTKTTEAGCEGTEPSRFLEEMGLAASPR